jgi:hypothetical protein
MAISIKCGPVKLGVVLREGEKADGIRSNRVYKRRIAISQPILRFLIQGRMLEQKRNTFTIVGSSAGFGELLNKS